MFREQKASFEGLCIMIYWRQQQESGLSPFSFTAHRFEVLCLKENGNCVLFIRNMISCRINTDDVRTQEERYSFSLLKMRKVKEGVRKMFTL